VITQYNHALSLLKKGAVDEAKRAFTKLLNLTFVQQVSDENLSYIKSVSTMSINELEATVM